VHNGREGSLDVLLAEDGEVSIFPFGDVVSNSKQGADLSSYLVHLLRGNCLYTDRAQAICPKKQLLSGGNRNENLIILIEKTRGSFTL